MVGHTNFASKQGALCPPKSLPGLQTRGAAFGACETFGNARGSIRDGLTLMAGQPVVKTRIPAHCGVCAETQRAYPKCQQVISILPSTVVAANLVLPGAGPVDESGNRQAFPTRTGTSARALPPGGRRAEHQGTSHFPADNAPVFTAAKKLDQPQVS